MTGLSSALSGELSTGFRQWWGGWCVCVCVCRGVGGGGDAGAIKGAEERDDWENYVNVIVNLQPGLLGRLGGWVVDSACVCVPVCMHVCLIVCVCACVCLCVCVCPPLPLSPRMGI